MKKNTIAHDIANRIFKKVMTRLEYQEEQNVPEYLGWRLVNTIEWESPNYLLTKPIASAMLSDQSLPMVTRDIIRKSFQV